MGVMFLCKVSLVSATATLFCYSSLCAVICLSRLVQVFVWFRLLDQFRFNVDPIDDFDIVSVANLET